MLSKVPAEAAKCFTSCKSLMHAAAPAEFVGCSPSLSGAIRVNPWSIDAVADAMFSAIKTSPEHRSLRHDKHWKYVTLLLLLLLPQQQAVPLMCFSLMLAYSSAIL
jgi:hypothetical protein